jgi:aminoglycoside phosphotransferase (APT) family kinase protein
MATHLRAPTLDPATVAHLIGAQFAELSPRRVISLGEGCDFRAYLVDDRWVFRLPKSAQGAACLRLEIAVLSALAPTLPLPVPDYRFVGTPCATFAYPFAGYAKLPGVPAMRRALSDDAKDAAAEALGAFLTCLHRQDVVGPAAADIPDRSSGIRMTQMRDEALGHLDAIESLLGLAIERQCRRFLTEDRPAAYGRNDRLIHADLTVEHVLVDPDGGEITGIIDWTDMRIDDVAFDFAGIWQWQGDRGVDIALRHYGGRVDSRVRDRIRYIGVWKALEDIRHGHQTGDDGYVEFSGRCLTRTFGT